MPIHTKIVGVTYDNPDGTDRQTIIASLTLQSQITLSRDYGNIYDPNAIAVLTAAREQIGFINRDIASELAPKMDLGSTYFVKITSLTGGDHGYSRGVNIRIDD